MKFYILGSEKYTQLQIRPIVNVKNVWYIYLILYSFEIVMLTMRIKITWSNTHEYRDIEEVKPMLNRVFFIIGKIRKLLPGYIIRISNMILISCIP